MTPNARPFRPHEMSTVFARTEHALAAQGWVPASPGIERAGQPVLCAGAMLVREAMALRGSPAAAAEFERKVVQRDRAFICEAARDVGLDVDVVRQRIAANDRVDGDVRLGAMIDQLRELRAPLAR